MLLCCCWLALDRDVVSIEPFRRHIASASGIIKHPALLLAYLLANQCVSVAWVAEADLLIIVKLPLDLGSNRKPCELRTERFVLGVLTARLAPLVRPFAVRLGEQIENAGRAMPR